MQARHWRSALLAIAVSLALGACGTKQSLEHAIKCDQFQRLPDGTWSTKAGSLDYAENNKQYQWNFGNGSIITGKKGGEEAQIVATLDKKCAPTH